MKALDKKRPKLDLQAAAVRAEIDRERGWVLALKPQTQRAKLLLELLNRIELRTSHLERQAGELTQDWRIYDRWVQQTLDHGATVAR